MVATLQELQAIGERCGIAFDSQRALRSNRAGKQPFEIEGRATPEQLCQFVAEIERSERLMVIENGSVMPSSESHVAFELGLATYHGEAR